MIQPVRLSEVFADAAGLDHVRPHAMRSAGLIKAFTGCIVGICCIKSGNM